MSVGDPIALGVIGGVFIIFGLGTIVWGKREKAAYYNALSTRSDLREFLDHWPPRLGHGALEAGGGIAVIVGVALLALAGVLWCFV
jgi:hypothetical protein